MTPFIAGFNQHRYPNQLMPDIDEHFDDSQLPALRVPPAERLALNAAETVTFANGLFRTLGRGQCGLAQAERLPDANVTIHLHEKYAAEETELLAQERDLQVTVQCTADFSEKPIDLFVLPSSRGGDAELTRDYLQQGFYLLEDGGTLIATTDNPKDTWLHHEVEKLGKSLKRSVKKSGVVYRLKKQKPLKRLRDFSHEFAFRDEERLIKVVSRPGVFSHRRLDLGARALMEGMTINPREYVLDIGCGAGTVALAAALRAPGVRVHAIDSNARAIDSTLQGAQLNALDNLTATLTASGELPEEGIFDVALGNPPYYSNFQIAEIFLQTARRGLKPGGRVYMVSKQDEWLIARMQQLFTEVTHEDRRGYTVVSAVRS